MQRKPKKKWELPLKVFFSYSSEDRAERNILDRHLQGLRDDGLITTWHDRQLALGRWKPQLDKYLEGADIFLCLVTRSFLTSKYCREIEFERTWERCDAGDCLIVPVALKACYWPDTLA